MSKQNNVPAVSQNPSTTRKIPLTTSFDNSSEASLFRRLLRYAEKKGFDKPQDVVRLAVSKFLDKEEF